MDNIYKIMKGGVTKRGKESKWKWEIHTQETDMLGSVRETERRKEGRRGREAEEMVRGRERKGG